MVTRNCVNNMLKRQRISYKINILRNSCMDISEVLPGRFIVGAKSTNVGIYYSLHVTMTN